MRLFATIGVVAALSISGAAIAGPSWTYVDLGAYIGDSSGKDNETEGVALRGSFGFANIWHVQAAVASGESNGGKSNTAVGSDDTAYGIRVGIHPSITDNTDLLLDIGYTEIDEKFGFGAGFTDSTDNTDVIDIRTGVRSNIGKVELRGFVSLGAYDGETSNDEGRDVVYSVGGQYNFSPAWSVGTDVNVADSGDLIDLYVRWSF